MKKNLLMTALLCMVCLAANAQKFALIDMEYILKNIPAYERANEQLNQLSKRWQSEVEAVALEAQTLYKNYQSEAVFLSAEQKNKKEVLAYYRIPAVCTVKLMDGANLLLQSRMPVYQLGQESSLPVNVILK